MSVHLMRELYGAQPNLKELGEKLAGQFAELSARPCEDKCDLLYRELADAMTAVAQMRTRLQRAA